MRLPEPLNLQTLEGGVLPWAALDGRVRLVVNTASRCGLSPQMAGLQALHARYAQRGLLVLGFPCNQFAGQEAGTPAQIGEFCTHRYGVGFPMMARCDVNGPGTHPLFGWLKAQAPGMLGTRAIKWNFTKFLIGRDGGVIARHAPTRSPVSMASDIEAALAA